MKASIKRGRLLLYDTTVKPEWIDHNGHMNVAFFVLAFDEATDAAYEHWGIGMDYPDSSGCSVFTLGINVDYLGELFEGDAIRVETTLVDHDAKRIHYFHRMIDTVKDKLVATNECLCMNVDLTARKSAPFPDDVIGKLAPFAGDAEPPKGFGRTLRIRRS
ncbi:MAG: thioesterase family protein [Gammaproteobacteria bacterium]|nr:thioesterase family protein [Gammaproteobacteria bacterium]